MTADEFTDAVGEFFDRALSIMRVKGRDYSPNHAALDELFQSAAEEDITPDTVLRLLLRKHWSAVVRWTRDGQTESEDIQSRMADVVNFIGMLSVWATPEGRDALVAGSITSRRVRCECGCVAVHRIPQYAFVPHPNPCEHGATVRALMKSCGILGSSLASWPMTRKALDLCRTDLSPTGDTRPPDPLPLRTAMPSETRDTSDTKSTP